MSAQSEYVTESWRRDSAYSPQTMQGPSGPSGPSFALLRSQAVRSRIQDWEISKDNPSLDFAIQGYSFSPEDPLSVPRSFCDNDTSSMALTLQSVPAFEPSCTDSVPSLSPGSSIGSGSSLPSSAGSVAICPGLLDSQGCCIGAPIAGQHSRSGPRARGIPCLFGFLCCQRTFEEAADWYEHSKSHLQGMPPPRQLCCPHPSCRWMTSQVDGETAWNERWKHLEARHDVVRDGEMLCEKREGQMFEYLWNIRLISAAQLQELKRSGRLGSNEEPFVITERSERRRHREGKQTTRRSANTSRR